MSRKSKKLALEFADREQYEAGLAILQDLDGWTLPAVKDRLAIIVDADDVELFKAARIEFEAKPVVSTSDLPIEERQRVRREMWPHMRARTGA